MYLYDIRYFDKKIAVVYATAYFYIKISKNMLNPL